MTLIKIIPKENDTSSGGIPRLRNINVHTRRCEIDLTFVDGTDVKDIGTVVKLFRCVIIPFRKGGFYGHTFISNHT
jgi:hypothetical protein